MEQKNTKEEQQTYFLSAEEELILVLEYRRRLSEFCNAFRDPRDQRILMPVSVPTTALHYLGRFYLYNSVMDYLPQIIMHTCIYLACKIEEFYVTITDYVHNLQGSEMDKMIMASAILNCELQTMQELQFHLIVHQPFRPVEGLLIDLKTRYPSLKDAESLRSAVEEFLERAHLTDTPLLYAPSQLALAAVTTAASKLGQNLDSYVTDTLFGGAGDRLLLLIDAVRKIKRLVKGCPARARAEVVEDLERRLAVCRNPVHDPSTVEYRRHQARLLQDHDDDDDGPLISSAGVTEDEEGDDEGVHVINNNTTNNDSCSSSGNSNDMSFLESNDSSHLVAAARREQQHRHQNGVSNNNSNSGWASDEGRHVLDGGVIDSDDSDGVECVD